jgi:hypothetical protein
MIIPHTSTINATYCLRVIRVPRSKTLQIALVRILLCEQAMYAVGLSNRTPSKRRLFCITYSTDGTASRVALDDTSRSASRAALLSVGRDQQNIAQNEFDELGARDDCGHDVRRRGCSIRKLRHEHQGGVLDRQDEKRERLMLSRRQRGGSNDHRCAVQAVCDFARGWFSHSVASAPVAFCLSYYLTQRSIRVKR